MTWAGRRSARRVPSIREHDGPKTPCNEPSHERPDATPAEPTPTAPEPAERIYFPELDGLRFVAFLMVYLFHGGVPSGVLKQVIGTAATDVFRENGGYGVQLFFILSGYLITTLLLREEARYGRIALGAFWIRRILRIWPLYYLIVLIGFFVIPGIDGQLGTTGFREMLKIHLLPFLAFLGNWSMALVRPAADWLSVLWSVCVEEQFYLIVPLFIAFVAPRLRRPLVVGPDRRVDRRAMVVRPSLRVAPHDRLQHVRPVRHAPERRPAGAGHGLGPRPPRPDPMAAMAPVADVPGDRLGDDPAAPRGGHALASDLGFVWVWLCGLGIVIVAVWGNGWLRAALSYSRIVWLGKISYGLYMYHEIALWARAYLVPRLGWFPNKEEILAIATLALTIGLAAASYYGYERRFLELKRAWTRVPSRPV